MLSFLSLSYSLSYYTVGLPAQVTGSDNSKFVIYYFVLFVVYQFVLSVVYQFVLSVVYHFVLSVVYQFVLSVGGIYM